MSDVDRNHRGIHTLYSEQHNSLINMGFESSAIYEALEASNGNLEASTAILLGEANVSHSTNVNKFHPVSLSSATSDAAKISKTAVGSMPTLSSTASSKRPALSSTISTVASRQQQQLSKADAREAQHNHIMATYKVQKCKEKGNHDKRFCLGWHARADRRRNPFENPYTCAECLNSTEDTPCKDGDNCTKAHNMIERMFHPELFKISMCQRGPNGNSCERGTYCAFAHNEDDHRIPLSQTLKNKAALAAAAIHGNDAIDSSGGIKVNLSTQNEANLVMQERLLKLIKNQGAEGIISSELPKRYLEAYNERLDIQDNDGERVKMKELLAHTNIHVVMHKGVQPKYVYDEVVVVSTSTSTGAAGAGASTSTHTPTVGSSSSATSASGLSTNSASFPLSFSAVISGTVVPIAVNTASALASAAPSKAGVVPPSPAAAVGAVDGSKPRRARGPPVATTDGSSSSSEELSLSSASAAGASASATTVTATPPLSYASLLSPGDRAGRSLHSTSSTATVTATPTDSIYFASVSEDALSSPAALVSATALSKDGATHGSTRMSVSNSDHSNNTSNNSNSMHSNSNSNNNSNSNRMNNQPSNNNNMNVATEFDFDDLSSSFHRRQQTSANDYGAFMGGLLVPPLHTPSSSQSGLGANNNSVLYELNNSSNNIINSNSVPNTPMHGGSDSGGGGMGGVGTIGGGAVGSTRRRGPAMAVTAATPTHTNSLSFAGSSSSHDESLLSVSASSSSRHGSPVHPSLLRTGYQHTQSHSHMQSQSQSLFGTSNIPARGGDNINGPNSSNHNSHNNNYNSSNSNHNNYNNSNSVDNNHNNSGSPQTNKIMQNQIMSLQNDLLMKSRESDSQNQRLIETLRSLSQSEERYSALKIEKEHVTNQLNQWRAKSNEFVDIETKLHLKTEEIITLKELVKEREAALARSELTKNSLIPELKQLRSRIVQLEEENLENKRKANDYDKMKSALSAEVDGLKAIVQQLRGATSTASSSTSVHSNAYANSLNGSPHNSYMNNSRGGGYESSSPSTVGGVSLMVSTTPTPTAGTAATGSGGLSSLLVHTPTSSHSFKPISGTPTAGMGRSMTPTASSAWDNDRARIALQAEVDSLRAQLNDLRRSMGSFQEYFPAAAASASASSRTHSGGSGSFSQQQQQANMSGKMIPALTSAGGRSNGATPPPAAGSASASLMRAVSPATATLTAALTTVGTPTDTTTAAAVAGGSYAPQGDESYKPVARCAQPGCECEGPHICTGCGAVGYCGLDHQKEHWKIHGKFCAGKK